MQRSSDMLLGTCRLPGAAAFPTKLQNITWRITHLRGRPVTPWHFNLHFAATVYLSALALTTATLAATCISILCLYTLPPARTFSAAARVGVAN